MDSITRKVYVYHLMPSCSANRISASGRLVVSRAAFPLCRCRETRWSSWLVVSRSSEPLCLARVRPASLAALLSPGACHQVFQTLWGGKQAPAADRPQQCHEPFCCVPGCLCARAPPGCAMAAARFEGTSGLVTVTSKAASFPSDHRRMRTSPGLAAVPGRR